MALNDLQIRQLKAAEKRQSYSVWDGNSLFVVVEPKSKASNSKSFVGRTRFPPVRGGKQIQVRIGVYGSGANQISLKEARDEWDRLRKWSKTTGKDPRLLKKEERKVAAVRYKNPPLIDAANSWLNQSNHRPSTRDDYENKINNQIVPVLGALTPVSEFNWSNGGRDKVLQLKEGIERRGAASQAQRVLMLMRQIFEFSIDRGWMEPPNPAVSSRLSRSRHKVVHSPHLDWEHLPQFFAELNENKQNGSYLVLSALKLTILTFQRVGSLVPMKFDEIDYKNDFWRIPPERMKSKEEHFVPLTDPIKKIVEKMGAINGDQEYVFFSSRGKDKPYVRENSLNTHLAKMGYRGRQSVHGFRSVALTCGTEQLGFHKDIIRRQMAHAIGDKTERSYLHAQFFKERREFMNAWSDAVLQRGLEV